ncbi:MAG: hypothetical protein ACI9MJ_000573 [Alphaproteobacteria bacterium]|jgi:hypothetical protein
MLRPASYWIAFVGMETAPRYSNGMNDAPDSETENLVELDMSPFSKPDLERIKALGEKQRLLYRWFRAERITRAGLDQYLIYSGDRTRTPYSAYRVERYRDGEYRLCNQRTDECIVTARTMGDVLDRLPDDFFYST